MDMMQRRVHRPRIIPVLLLKGDGLLYKTRSFKDPVYIGDPRIAVKIFNDKCADEIIILDIDATIEKREPNYELISDIAGEAFMPMAYGGGITKLEQAKIIFSLGVEKIIINSAIFGDPDIITRIAEFGGSQSVIVAIDAKKDIWGRWRVWDRSGKRSHNTDPVQHAKRAQGLGAGEIFINAIKEDGTFSGYNYDLCNMVSRSVSIPVIACGGASKLEDCVDVIKKSGVSAAAAGSIFVFQGPHRAVLIKFPDESALNRLFLQNNF